jgi:transglutaminase-like putative cysteine protease
MSPATLAPPPPPEVPAAPDPVAALRPSRSAPGGVVATGRFTVRDGLWFAAFAALLGLCMVRWVGLLEHPPIVAVLGFALGSAAVALAIALIPAGHPRLRALAAVAAAVVLTGVALLAAGLPLWLLDPRDWGTLFPGLSDGVSALPGVTVPYKGQGDWVRITIATGGGLLVVLAAVLAGLGRRGLALLPVVVLFAVPAIQISSDHPWIVGAAFSLPLCAALLAPRLPSRLVPVAVALVVGSIVLGMAAAPLLDGDGPVVDVQDLASALEPEQADQFDWSHGYGPMDWPRDGRVLLRVKATRPAYWKAEDLEAFDGAAWRSEGGGRSIGPITEGVAEHPEWHQEVRVTVRGMQTPDFIAPGQTLSISRAPRQPVNTQPGRFQVSSGSDELKNGSAYVADSYVPKPRAAQLRTSPPTYPGSLTQDLTMLTPATATAGRTLIRFPAFGSDGIPLALGPGVGSADAVGVLQRSGYGRMYELAQTLRTGATTPYEVVRRVEGYLADPRFVYEEKVAAQRNALPAFLFQTHAGYCQHFSGAMALLLRMAGVPARVSAGFTPGKPDAKTGEYVVRDTDAHSWVEVWFAGIGWVSFDPTPAAAPARSQSAAGAVTSAGGSIPTGPSPRGAIGGGADLGPAGNAPVAETGGGGDASPAPWIALVVVVVALGLAARGLWHRRGLRRLAHAGEDPMVAELERALRRSGRSVPEGTTLLELERRFAHQAGAREYVRALADRRYGPGGPGPTAAQRRALRSALGAGLGLRGRLRALWALPPRPLA